MAEKLFKKTVSVGDGAVGKTCHYIVFCTNKFPDEYVPTVFDNYCKEMEVDGIQLELALWDTGGGEDYARLRPLSYPDTGAFLLCFCVESRSSFDNIPDYWIKELKYHCPDVPVVLVANKIDLRDDEYTKDRLKKSGKTFVTTEEGEEMASKIKAYAYVECSALTKEGVQDVFETIARAGLQYVPRKKRKNCFLL